MAKKRTKLTKEFLPGIDRLEWVDPTSLDANPLNWKKHPHRQRQALTSSIGVNGWAGAALYNEITKHLIDGHCRKEEAIKRGDKVIPVLIGRWTEEQEKHLLATLDPIGAMYQTQAEALSALTESVHNHLNTFKERSQKHHKEVLGKLNADLDTFASDIASGEVPSVMLERRRSQKEYDKSRSTKSEVEESHETGVYRTEMAEDPIFSSSNSFGIPDLKADSLSTTVPQMVWVRSTETVGSPKRGEAYYCYSAGPATFPNSDLRHGGVLGFFTEDFRFERVWNDVPKFTKELLGHDFSGVLVPDFSTWSDWPLALRIHQLYKSRYVARYWQEAGIPIIPIVQSLGPTDFDDDKTKPADTLSATLCLHTLPQECPVLATEARNSQGEEGYWAGWVQLHKLALQIIRPKTLVIYGGKENGKYFLPRLPKTKTKIILLSSFITRRRKGD